MATGKPPWSQQYQEVAALFHVGTTKSHPPIPEHLSVEAKDFLQKCLQKEPELRPSACDLLQHSFVTGESMQSPVICTSSIGELKAPFSSLGKDMEDSLGSIDVCNLGTLNFPTVNSEKLTESSHGWGERTMDDDMCQIDDKDDFMVGGEAKLSSVLMHDDFNKSFNPICEPSDDWRCKYDETHEPEQRNMTLDSDQPVDRLAGSSDSPRKGENDFSFQGGPSLSEDDDEVTESKIRAFLDEKALELKKLQTPLYKEFYNSLSASSSVEATCDESPRNYLKLPPKSKSPNRVPIGTPSTVIDAVTNASPGSSSRRMSNVSGASTQSPQGTPSPQCSDWKGLLVDAQQESSPGASFSEIQRKWKEELDQELERKREMMRQVGVGGKTSSPKDRGLNRQRDRSRFASPGK